MDALAAYGSSSSEEAASDSSRPPSPSPDSAAERAAAAEARLAALDSAADAAEAASAAPAPGLPDPLAALDAAAAPAFLRPAATRQLAPPIHGVGTAAGPTDGVVASAVAGAAPVAAAAARPPPRDAADAVSRMAPPLKKGADGPSRDGDDDERSTKRARTGLTETAAAALLGAAPRAKPSAAAATRARPLEDALAHGAALPRRGTAAKERQQRVAARGERASGAWKSEAEMLLRQQYD